MAPIVGTKSEFDGLGEIMPPSVLPGSPEYAMYSVANSFMPPVPVPAIVPTVTTPISTPLYSAPSVPPMIPGSSQMAPTPPTMAPPSTVPGTSMFPLGPVPLYSEEGAIEGRATYDRLTNRHPALLQPWVFDFKRMTSLPMWFDAYKDDLKALEDLTLNINTTQITGLIDYLVDIIPGRKLIPSELVALVKKLILHEQVSFPEVEIDNRVIKFLKETFVKEDGTQPSSEDLFLFLMAHADDQELKAQYEKMKALEKLASELRAPIDIKIQALLDQRLPIVVSRREVLAKIRDLEAKVNRGEYVLDSELTGLREQFAQYTSIYDEIERRINAVYEEFKTIRDLNPEAFPGQDSNGLPLGIRVSDLIESFVKKFLESGTGTIIRVVSDVLEAKGREADASMNRLYEARQANMDARVKQFETFFKNKVRGEIDPYEKKINDAINGYNGMAEKLERMNQALKDIDAKISRNVQERLGEVIGWYCHKSNIPSRIYKEAWFLTMVLNRLVEAPVVPMSIGVKDGQRLYDSEMFEIVQGVKFIGGEVKWFWKELPETTSAFCAGETLALLNDLREKERDFKYGEGARIRAYMETVKAWIEKLRVAYQITIDRVNSEAYVKQTMNEFKGSPEQLEMDKQASDIQTEIRFLTASISSKQEEFSDLIYALEMKLLEERGIVIGFFETEPFEEKLDLYRGVNAYVEKITSAMESLGTKFSELLPKIQARTASSEEVSTFSGIYQTLNIMLAANLIKTRLNEDSSFQIERRSREEKKAQDGL